MDFDAVKRDRQARAVRRAAEFIEAGEEAMGYVCDWANTLSTGGDSAILGCVCDGDEMAEVRLELRDLAAELERG